MEIVNEVTARLENKPGRLAKICSAGPGKSGHPSPSR